MVLCDALVLPRGCMRSIDGVGDDLHEVLRRIERRCVPGSFDSIVLAAGIADASDLTNRNMLSGLRAPQVHTTGTSTVARSAADG